MSVEQSQYAKFNEAMAEFQKEYKPPKKDKNVNYTAKGRTINYDYADLQSLQQAIRETASKHGLSWNVDFEYEHTTIMNYQKEQRALMIVANVVINHSSGVEKTFKGVPLFATSFDPQSIGSIKTYSERYALSGAFGIASDDDDDGQVATDQHNKQQNNQQQYNQQQNNQQSNNRPPTQAELDQELQNEIKQHQNFLLDKGIELGTMYKWIVDKENVDRINQVEPVRIMGYLKSQVQKIKKEEAQKENQQNQPQDDTEQTSLMEGNTTQTINWGSAE